jgi:hypothetical protein
MVYNTQDYWVFWTLSYALVFMDLVCWLGLLHNISTSFSILVSGLCMLYNNFDCTFSCYIPMIKPGLHAWMVVWVSWQSPRLKYSNILME